MLEVKHENKTFAAETAAELTAMGVPQVVVDEALALRRQKGISAECRRRIYDVASVEAQMNMAAAVGVISGKTASARSEDEKSILAGAEAAIGWVAAMRAAVATLAADADADFTADVAWPDVPPEALAMIQHF
ncbi:hypothetical protein [Pseudophaeobacter sp. 1A09344]|uniref:hypothetical protein n=1 Tax=Pseudophaeobacter sp. 1A09344 TaxID=3098144 RepID=UPI0034D4FBB5